MKPIEDTFRGNTSSLRNNIAALLELDEAGALVPHGIGGHARTLLSAAHVRLGGCGAIDCVNACDGDFTHETCPNAQRATTDPHLEAGRMACKTL